jgi:hypothetical protein
MSLLTEISSTVMSTRFLVTPAAPVAPVEPTFAPVYGKASNINAQTTASGSLIQWTFGATQSPTSGFANVPDFSGTTFTIASAGVYQYTLSVLGRCDPFIGVGISVNGSAASVNTFGSPVSNGVDTVLCSGSGIVLLEEGDEVGVQNRSDTDLIHTEQLVAGNSVTMNANFTLQRIA